MNVMHVNMCLSVCVCVCARWQVLAAVLMQTYQLYQQASLVSS